MANLLTDLILPAALMYGTARASAGKRSSGRGGGLITQLINKQNAELEAAKEQARKVENMQMSAVLSLLNDATARGNTGVMTPEVREYITRNSQYGNPWETGAAEQFRLDRIVPRAQALNEMGIAIQPDVMNATNALGLMNALTAQGSLANSERANIGKAALSQLTQPYAAAAAGPGLLNLLKQGVGNTGAEMLASIGQGIRRQREQELAEQQRTGGGGGGGANRKSISPEALIKEIEGGLSLFGLTDNDGSYTANAEELNAAFAGLNTSDPNARSMAAQTLDYYAQQIINVVGDIASRNYLTDTQVRGAILKACRDAGLPDEMAAYTINKLSGAR